MSELPKGWVLVDLGSVCEVVRGITFPASAKEATHTQSNVCCLRTSNIQREIDWRDVYFVPQEYVKRESQFVRPGDILMSMANSYELVGKVAVIRRNPLYPTAFGAFLSAIRTQVGIEDQYLFHLLRTEKIQRELRQGSSQTVNIANISVKTLSAIEIPISPLNEQKRIADKLDRILAKVDACRERCDRIPLLLKRFRQSVLAAATSGQLTEDWRERQGITQESWKQMIFKEACKEITVGFVGKMANQYREEGIPFLRSLNVRPFRFEPKNLQFISPEFHRQILKSRLRPGDVVVVRTGAPGQCCVIPDEIEEANCSDLVIVRPKETLLPGYACIFINSSQSQEFVRSEIVGVAQSHFNVGSMKITPLNLPILEEQQEIVRRVETLFAYADRLEAQYQKACAHIDRLTPALLDKAFRGELVPQDPKDEPASVLLERIQAERQARPQGKAVKSKQSRGETRRQPKNY